MGISRSWTIRLLCVAKTHCRTAGIVNRASPTHSRRRVGISILPVVRWLLCSLQDPHVSMGWLQTKPRTTPDWLPSIQTCVLDVSRGCAPKNCKKMQHCSWTACGSSCWIREKWWGAAIALFHSLWIPALLSRCFPGGLNSTRQAGQTMGRTLEVSTKPQHTVCFEVNLYVCT